MAHISDREQTGKTSINATRVHGAAIVRTAERRETARRFTDRLDIHRLHQGIAQVEAKGEAFLSAPIAELKKAVQSVMSLFGIAVCCDMIVRTEKDRREREEARRREEVEAYRERNAQERHRLSTAFEKQSDAQLRDVESSRRLAFSRA